MSQLSRSSGVAAIPLRAVVGYGFVAHGLAKIMNGPDAFAASLHGLGVPAPLFMAWTTIVTELAGGLAVLAGAWVTLASVPLAIVMIVAMVTVHLRFGFTSIKLRGVTAAGPQFGPPGYEMNLLYLAALATLVIGGSGPFAIDRWRARRSLVDVPLRLSQRDERIETAGAPRGHQRADARAHGHQHQHADERERIGGTHAVQH